MNFKPILFTLLLISLFSCKSQYQVVEISGTIVEMDSIYDVQSQTKMSELVNSYKLELDIEMNEVIGRSAYFMDYKRPQSLLTNLTSDVMKAFGDEHLSNGADVSLMNVHGHRSTMPKGEITIGNLYEIYSFDNTITFIELKGSDLKEIFNAYARLGGAGLSSNVKLIIEDKKVKEVTIDDKTIDNGKTYNIVTLDYLADGNDSMTALLQAVSVNDTGITLRDMMIDWVKEQSRQGKMIESSLDGRIQIID